LESVAVLALSTSPRARRESELISAGAAEATIEAVAESAGRRIEMFIRLTRQGERTQKTIRVDGVTRRAVDLPGEIRATLFWPEDLSLVKGGPEHRRRFLNEMLVQVVAGHGRLLAGYRRVLEQRNHLLKRISAGQEGTLSLDVWNEKLVTLADSITSDRRAALEQLAPLAAAVHRTVSDGEAMTVTYLGPPPDLGEALARAVGEDIRRGATSLGPHRDDLLITIEGSDGRSFASQGQQRTAVVSLKLAESDLIEARSGERPVLLLDDVLSELDLSRRGALLERVGDSGQVIVTSVEADPFPPALMQSANVHTISGGRVDSCG
ncbi:MAG: DNA replication and repair protein RecF, partial [Candidatus Dormibacteraeota bacterium]|nr:DNA replication and repair protein RecF [Candidatus Dormibacteraeota bacterium]